MLRLSFLVRPFLGLVLLGWTASASADDGRPSYLAGYADDAAFAAQMEALQADDAIKVRSLGESAGGRDVWLITLGRGDDVDEKPAIAIVGSIEGSHLLGSELTVRIAQQLAEDSREDDTLSSLLDRYTFYIVPRPDPDRSAKCFAKPMQTPVGNDRVTDDDRDFEQGEDPADDLNGDGFITQMRVEDETGDYIIDPADERVLIAADRKKNERGRYRLLTEGRDDDQDEQFNEDGSGGVAINHNFPHGYKPFQPHTGEHAAAESETRLLADFFFDHPNIAVVFTFAPENNLFSPWKPSQDKERIRKTIFPADATLLELVASDYKKLHGGSDPPPAPTAHGSLSQWGYFQYGRWSLSSRGWWVPKTEAPKAEEAKTEEATENKSEDQPKSDEDKPAADKVDAKASKKADDDKRGADERNLLRWLKANELDGFVEWKAVEHPDFPGKTVEVGGFKPLVGLNPPAKELDDLAERHLQFIRKLPEYLPELAIIDAKAENLGGGLFRVTATAINRGYLPTMPEMGSVSGHNYPLQMSIELPKQAELLQGHARERLTRLEGGGGKTEKTWLVRFTAEAPAELQLKAWAPAVGTATAKAPLQ